MCDTGGDEFVHACGACRLVADDRQILEYDLPLAEIIFDFFDKLKSITSGYGTMDYHIKGFKSDSLAKMDVLVNGDPVEALSLIVHRSKAEARGRHLLKRLKEQIDRHLFVIPLQAAIGGKIIARPGTVLTAASLPGGPGPP